MFCRLLLRFLTSVRAVLCSLLAFPCLSVGALLAYGASLQSRLSLTFVVSPPSQVSVCPSPALAVGWFGHMSVAPPAAPVCWALVGSLYMRRSVALGSCAPSPAGSSLEDSSGLVVQAPGVFLDSLLGFFPLASAGYWLLGVVLGYPWLSTLCRLTEGGVTLVFCRGRVGLPHWGRGASGFLGPAVFMVFAMGTPVSGRACGLPQSTIVAKPFPPSGGFGS